MSEDGKARQLSKKFRAHRRKTFMKTLPWKTPGTACSPLPHSSTTGPRDHGARSDFAGRPSLHSGAQHRKRGGKDLGWEPAQIGQIAAFKGAGQFSLQQYEGISPPFRPPYSCPMLPTNQCLGIFDIHQHKNCSQQVTFLSAT